MSIFSNILHKIFPADHPAVTGAPTQSPSGASTPAPAPSAPMVAATTPAAAALGAAAPVDVEAVLTDLAAKNGQSLNWRTSIVDLMKLLQLDSDLASRKELAKELSFTGDTTDSASMNIWLHKQVMTKLAENGGKVPDSLKV